MTKRPWADNRYKLCILSLVVNIWVSVGHNGLNNWCRDQYRQPLSVRIRSNKDQLMWINCRDEIHVNRIK